jgi:hypothetical protein
LRIALMSRILRTIAQKERGHCNCVPEGNSDTSKYWFVHGKSSIYYYPETYSTLSITCV